LVIQARHRIAVAIGGGLHLKDAARLAQLTGAAHFHGSLRRRLNNGGPSNVEGGKTGAFGVRYVVDAGDVRSIIHRLQNA
jgi:copper homeostasis protein